MPNPLINSGTTNVARQATSFPQNPMALMGQFMQNPVGALRQVGYAIPDGMSNPQEIVNHLINNGQLNRGKLGQLQQMARFFGKR